MQLSQNDIRLIVRLVSEKLGPNAGIEEIKNLVSEIINRLPSSTESYSPPNIAEKNSHSSKRLIVNAFGPNLDGLENKTQDYVAGKHIQIFDMTSTVIDNFRSVIAIIDYSKFGGDINQLKFEISKLCESLGFKAIIQDGSYYGG